MSKRTVCVPMFVLDNLDTLGFTAKTIDMDTISKQSGMNKDYLAEVIRGNRKPSQKSYNAIAEFMHWQKWTV